MAPISAKSLWTRWRPTTRLLCALGPASTFMARNCWATLTGANLTIFTISSLPRNCPGRMLEAFKMVIWLACKYLLFSHLDARLGPAVNAID